jgi:hypothetical protein
LGHRSYKLAEKKRGKKQILWEGSGIRTVLGLDMVAHICNPNYLEGGGDQYNCGFRLARTKLARPHFNK